MFSDFLLGFRHGLLQVVQAFHHPCMMILTPMIRLCGGGESGSEGCKIYGEAHDWVVAICKVDFYITNLPLDSDLT